mmetsp:Transcript_20089/g.65754  ORF Transcript_20089/g.65754 Transcript_20089/m.65754 type:complete len:217 (+) Transcript_20089:334-984(+)
MSERIILLRRRRRRRCRRRWPHRIAGSPRTASGHRTSLGRMGWRRGEGSLALPRRKRRSCHPAPRTRPTAPPTARPSLAAPPWRPRAHARGRRAASCPTRTPPVPSAQTAPMGTGRRPRNPCSRRARPGRRRLSRRRATTALTSRTAAAAGRPTGAPSRCGGNCSGRRRPCTWGTSHSKRVEPPLGRRPNRAVSPASAPRAGGGAAPPAWRQTWRC